MVRPKGSAEKVETPPYRERMELRSMSRSPPPSYTRVDRLNLHDDSTSRQKNGPNKIELEEDDDSPTIVIRDDCAKFPRCRNIIFCTSGLLILLFCVVLVSFLFPYPLHASCTVKWKFEDSCTHAMQKFRYQILSWSSCANCGPRGSRCLYRLKKPKPDEDNVIRAVHLASNMRTVETIKIAFEEVNKTCVATGESVSNEWFRIFDYGTNYCNLRNLVTGIGFDKISRFLELTTNAICTQYNMAICD